MNDVQNLLTLGNGIVVRVKNLYFRPKPVRGLFGRCGLLVLVTVIVWKRNNEMELLQGRPPWRIEPTIQRTECIPVYCLVHSYSEAFSFFDFSSTPRASFSL